VGQIDDAHLVDEWELVSQEDAVVTVETIGGSLLVNVSLYDGFGNLVNEGTGDNLSFEVRASEEGQNHRVVVTRQGGALGDTSGTYSIALSAR